MKTPAASILDCDLHSHTIASGHAFNTINEMALTAAAKGIRAIAITDHGPSMEGAASRGYFEVAYRVPRVMHGVHILMGCEANIVDVDGSIDIDGCTAEALAIIGVGIHERTPYPRDCTPEENTAALVNAIANTRVGFVAHPYHPAFPIDVATVVDAACECGTLIEVNLSLLMRSLQGHGGIDDVIVQTRLMVHRLRAHQMGFLLNSDAHHSDELGASADVTAMICEALEVDHGMILNARPEFLSGLIELNGLMPHRKGTHLPL